MQIAIYDKNTSVVAVFVRFWDATNDFAQIAHRDAVLLVQNDAHRIESCRCILMAKKKDKVAKVMGEYKRGTLHSGKPGPGKGPTVTSRKQAVAIALSEAGKARKPKGKK